MQRGDFVAGRPGDLEASVLLAGVCDITVRSARIDSLTSSIQCASSIHASARPSGHRDGIHELGQPLPPGIRIDLGQLHIGIGDAHQVIEERQVLRVCIANLGIDLRSGGMRVKTLDAGGRAQQPRHDVEGDLAGV